MFLLISLFLQSLDLVIGDFVDFHPNDYRIGNILTCPLNKICTPVHYCPDIVSLLNEGTLPVHRFRQAMCGYVGINPKVCCNSPRDFGNSVNDPRSLDPKFECGKTLVRSNMVTLGSYPFLARIGYINLDDRSVKYPCSGTIINERTILTTASCALMTIEEYKLQTVVLGEFNTETDPDCNPIFCAHCTRSYNVSFIVKHPNYRPEVFDKNIALIRLDEAISFTLTIQPICYKYRQYFSVGSMATLIGWGKFSVEEKEFSTDQRALPMKLLPFRDCVEFTKSEKIVEMCAIGPQEPCTEFDGSPLIRRDGNGYALIGILSPSSDCDMNKNSPSVFVNIQKYAIWISENS